MPDPFAAMPDDERRPDDEPPSDDQRPPLPPFVAPPEFVERAREFRASGLPVAPAAPSATVMLLRDGAAALEVFMLRRQASMVFAAGMHVFPGGRVDPADREGRDVDDALLTTAMRETFEECGVLLASGEPADPDALEADRIALIEHRLSFDAVLARHGLVARPEWLRPWSRWVTPDFESRRYDTHFFVAPAQPGRQARDLGGESDAAEWVTPAKALAAQEARDWLLMPPTATTLRELVPFRRAADVFEAAATRDLTARHADIDLDANPPVFFFRTTT